MSKEVSLERCLESVPNRFELAILVMNRARDILYGAKSRIESTKYTKKSINKAMKEIEENDLDLGELEKKIKQNLLVNNLFLKDNKNAGEINDNEEIDLKSGEDLGDGFDNLDEELEDGDDLDDEIEDDEINGELDDLDDLDDESK